MWLSQTLYGEIYWEQGGTNKNWRNIVKMILIFIITSILCTNSYAFECQGSYKTQWFDRDDPSGKGDFEDLVNLRKEYPDQICSNPTACEVETISGIPASKTEDSIPECTILLGFACVNTQQSNRICQDYKIRFTCPESVCDCKTQWFDRDDPSDNGDYEDLVNLRKQYPDQICSSPAACEVETTSGVPASSSGDNIPECSISSGFACVNSEQKDGNCEDYRIRFTCPQSFCNCKTRWFDRDDPSGHGDFENLINLRKENPGQICNTPTVCEVETTSGISNTNSGDNITECSISTGFACVNKDQTDGSCEDYKIRFGCPESFCSCKTQWFDRDDPSGKGDYEDLVNLRKEYPGQICSNPTACEAETTSEIPVATSGDNVSDCSVSTGFACVNAEQEGGSCEDYKIRFTCPESFCNCKTQWFDRDDPSVNGDYEDLANLRKEYPDQICGNPTACEVETITGISALNTEDNIPQCSVSSGFACVNAEQKDGKCEDYRIRFTCPESFCNCKTEWFDRDNPSGKGDYEDLVNLRKQYPDQICNNPTACEVETTSGMPASSTGDKIPECNISTGFVCVNKEQQDESCEDYRIRFTCPEYFCSCKTPWFDYDNPSGNGDYEDLQTLRKQYPGQICGKPTACEVETTSGIPASGSGDNTAECSISTGFVCVNNEQNDGNCEDYRIRFTCPESFCNCRTEWFDRDNPSGNGDYENLMNLRKEYPDQICNNPMACEVETTTGIPASGSGDNIPQCNISYGFACVNAEQEDGSCEDYKIRFTCPQLFCNCKTQWFDRDNPSGDGDFEDLANLRNDYPDQICNNPTACEVETTSGVSIYSTGDNISDCSISTGFSCVNKEQEDGSCEDYKIRFTCPEAFCNCQTQWFDRDDPSGNGDNEDLVNLRNEYPNQICSNPIGCEVETTSGIPGSSTGENIPECSISDGFTCVNEEQDDGHCEDYRIRFTCPESFCDCQTQWFDRDNPSGYGDYEDLVNLRKEYPQQICSNPILCEVETTSGIPASSIGDNIPECNITTGFICVNAEQGDGSCEDYRIRFTCPESFCNCKTQWFDRDNPSENGDYEDLVNLRKQYPDLICSNPTACEVETTSGIPASSTGDNIPECNIFSGFVCVNKEQQDGSCEDYRIRFNCPEIFCNCKTEWFDSDNPSGKGDYEDLVNLRKEYPGQICSNPTACEIETTSGLSASNTADNIPQCNISSGFACVNEEQNDGNCEDYRIRFICPESFCNCKTEWFDRDNPSGKGDYEDLFNLRKEYPSQICSIPTACEVETTSGIPASNTGDNIPQCSIVSGFICVNEEQEDGACEDYRVRFTCPASFCNCKTKWFDRDNPSGNGDYEDLMSLQKDYPGEICSDPIACEVETTSGIPASSSGDNIAPCTISSGFVCANQDQKDRSCEDYKIRFICPEAFCNCKTRWFDRDDPSGSGDYEDLVNLQKENPGQICHNPISCEVATTSETIALDSGDNIPECSVSTGFTCVNAQQEDGSCEDYKIQFTCPQTFCNCRTQWFDRDDPTGSGDFEGLANLQKEHPRLVCSNPTACEVETTSGTPASDSGDNVAPCSPSTGFICVNKDQDDETCEDYRIRFVCPQSFCSCVTQWFDHDDPSGTGDFEVLRNLRNDYPDKICNHPTGCEVETISGIPASSSEDDIQQCSISTGFTCINAEQRNGSCEDYRVRFICPESFCSCKTQWFDRDDPSGNGDYEDLLSLQKEYADQICSSPIACEVETISGVPISNSGDIVSECSISTGFSCVNAEQKDQSCQDYRIRFTCPHSFCTKRTPWFDRDDPSGTGDFEDLENLRKEYPTQICSNPIGCEVETVSGQLPSSTGDIVTECSTLTGFVCMNEEQTTKLCNDYRIRFICP
ncbi:uncharacterized protein si:dkey-205h13.2 isoform X1 [Scyliorhinus canicula]|uniref:uncharacterized protein si:dkey-205h13.2 isoform X1 n=2 Tax=Scyliorhinus canicula TaxID=7830 RepID=UPI0018F27FB7|nr:uncharacterized protein si:dkey-205h13.2 isoform X1 [Scyliorhinus canicula]